MVTGAGFLGAGAAVPHVTPGLQRIEPGMDIEVGRGKEWEIAERRRGENSAEPVAQPDAPIFSFWNSLRVLPKWSFQSMRPLADLP